MSRSIISTLRRELPGAMRSPWPDTSSRRHVPGPGDPNQVFAPDERPRSSPGRRAPKPERPWKNLYFDWSIEPGSDVPEAVSDDSIREAKSTPSDWKQDGRDLANEFDEQVRERGLDVLAYYRSYHHAIDGWGIYIREDALRYVAATVFGRVSDDPEACHRAAFQLLYDHEYFHYLTDVAATCMEFQHNRPLYLPHFDACHASSPPWSLMEEGLANMYAIEGFAKHGERHEVERFAESQPAGYRDFVHRGYETSFPHFCQKLAAEILETRATQVDPVTFLPDGPSIPLAELLFDTKGALVNYGDVPLYLVPSFRFRSSEIVLYHIARIPTVMEGNRARKKLEKLDTPLRYRWDRAKAMMAQDVHQHGLNFEKLKGRSEWSVRLDRSYRAKLRLHPGGQWELTDIGKHDDVY